MKHLCYSVKTRILTSKLGSLLLLFQRSPLVQMLFPEAKLLGGAGLGEVTKWTVATVAGLGAYDTVTGATQIVQTYPEQNSETVPAFTNTPLNFVFQVVETPSTDKVSWSVSGLPSGLDHQDLSTPSTHLIFGTPTEEGSTTVTVTAWEKQNQMGASFSKEFVIEVGPPIITSHPASVAVASGTKATLSVVGDPSGGTLSYQWYRGITGDQSTSVGTGASFTTPQNQNAGNTPASFWVKVTKNGVSQYSNTATVTIATTAPSITTQPASSTIQSGGTATLTVGVSGSSPSIQWFRGNAGVTTNPVVGATATTFTTPSLTTTTSYWARATNGLGTANSNTATVTVNAAVDPYEEWRASQFNSTQLADPLISGPTADPDGDRIVNQDEYLFGTLPLVREPSPLTFSINGGNISLGFTARQATGPGYGGKTRHYSLETRTNLSSGTWTPITGFSDIVGGNQPVTHSTPLAPPRAFYTLRVWLTP